jgi:hypothetical protein
LFLFDYPLYNAKTFDIVPFSNGGKTYFLGGNIVPFSVFILEFSSFKKACPKMKQACKL